MRFAGAIALACATFGCGRIGFDPGGLDPLSPDADPLVPDADPSAPDANAAARIEDWGEDTGTDHGDVTIDTYLSGKCCAPDETIWNYGASDQLDLDSDGIPLIRFDLSALPPGTTILSATLRLHRSTEGGNAPAIAIHVVTEDWQEGTLDGAAGAASWTMRTSTQTWTTPGAMPPSSQVMPAASAPSGPAGAVFLDLRVPVEAWVNNSAANFGFAVLGSGDDSGIEPREAADGQRPRLTIEYIQPSG